MRKAQYNDPKILDAVSKLERTRAAIEAELHPDRHHAIVETIVQTIGSLNDADDLIPFQKQVTTQIITPVTTRIEKGGRLSLAVSVLFGVFGIVTFALSYVQSPTKRIEASLTEMSTTMRSLAKTPDQTNSEPSAVKSTIAVIYPDDVHLSASVLGKYIDCKQLLANYIALATKEEADRAQASLNDSLSPYRHAEFLEVQRELSLVGLAARTPPRQLIVHPYDLAEAAASVKSAFTVNQLRAAWTGCSP